MTDRAAGLPRRTSHILAQVERLHQRGEAFASPTSLPEGEETSKEEDIHTATSNNPETYQEYKTKTIFGKDGTADAHRQQRRDRRQRKSLVSNLQIAQARIAASSEEDADDVDVCPYLFSEDED